MKILEWLLTKEHKLFRRTVSNVVYFGFQVLVLFTILYAILIIFGFGPRQLQGQEITTPRNVSNGISSLVIFETKNNDVKLSDNIEKNRSNVLSMRSISDAVQDSTLVIKTVDHGTEVDKQIVEAEELKKNDPAYTATIPTRITIPQVDIDTVINVPSSIEIPALDAALQEGAVYYPGSGTLQGGNMFIFGHSSNWKFVNNKAYKAFNNLEDVTPGDEIYLESEGKTFVYAVDSVAMVTEDEALVEFNQSGRKLTISTCNTFGQKSDRWVVEATFTRVQ